MVFAVSFNPSSWEYENSILSQNSNIRSSLNKTSLKKSKPNIIYEKNKQVFSYGGLMRTIRISKGKQSLSKSSLQSKVLSWHFGQV